MAMVLGMYHPIRDMCGRRENWRLRVKLVRVWNMTPVANPREAYAIQMVSVDEEVFCINFMLLRRIEATIPKQHMIRFEHSLVEGEVYKLTNFGLLRNGGKFRAVVHDFKLVFNATTRFIPCQHFSIAFTGFSLMKTTDIKKTNGHSEYLLVSEEIILAKEGRGKIRCAVFGDLVDVVASCLTLPRIGLPVAIIQLAKVNIYKDAIEFKNGLAVHEIETDVAVATISDRARPISLKDEFMKFYPKKTVGQLQECAEDGLFVIMATIDEVVQERFWWYMSCACMRSVSYDDDAHFCEYCGNYVYELTPRYKLKVTVINGTDTVNLIMFDSECYALLNKSCRDLLSENKPIKSIAYPADITNLIGNEFLF
ncbi:hypothetical protein SESBI_44641 [Sesbania bispinosa]|nr:hypothetical protein SESBI_44641 [Sesbania bispinosa]